MDIFFELLSMTILMHSFVQIHCQPKNFAACRSDLQIVRHNCSLTCSVANSSKVTTFLKNGTSVGGCSGLGSCSPSANRDYLKNEVYLQLTSMSYSHAGTYSCSYLGSLKEAIIDVDSDIMNSNLVVNINRVQGLASISCWCLTNHSLDKLKYELQGKDGNVIEGADIRVKMNNTVTCEYPEESAYTMLAQMKKEYCSGKIIYGKGGLRIIVKLGQQEKAFALNYTCEVCVCSKIMFLGVVAASLIVGVIICVRKKRQRFKLISVPSICALYGTIMIMSLLITLILDFTVVTCKCAVKYGAGIGISFACDTILFWLLICFCFDGRASVKRSCSNGIYMKCNCTESKTTKKKEAVPAFEVTEEFGVARTISLKSMGYKPESNPFISKPEHDVFNIGERLVPLKDQNMIIN